MIVIVLKKMNSQAFFKSLGKVGVYLFIIALLPFRMITDYLNCIGSILRLVDIKFIIGFCGVW